MKRAFEEEVFNVEVNWSRPKLYTNALNTEYERLEQVYYYKILARYKGNYKLLYIGRTGRYATERLLDRDHIKKREKLEEDHPRHEILVSFGEVLTDRKRNSRLIDEVESLLIYIHTDNDHPHLVNKSNTWSHNITRDYHIHNTGFRAEGMIKEIGLGLFYK